MLYFNYFFDFLIYNSILINKRKERKFRGSSRGIAFGQHLYNNIFKGKLEKVFTSQGILDHPLEYFIIYAPEEINSIIGKKF